MRYLYGDSTPFPYDFDFLLTLGAFMTAATRVVQLEAEAQRQGHELAKGSEARGAGLEQIARLHQDLVSFMDQAVAPSVNGPRGTFSDDTHPAALDYAKKLKDYSARVVHEQRQVDKDTYDRESARLASDHERRSIEIKAAIDEFFRVSVLPVLSSRSSLKLLEGKDHRYEVGVVFRNLGDVVTSFVLSAAKSPQWSTPKKVADLMPGFDLRVGAKKAFFKGTVTPELVHLDDYVLSRADIHDRGCEIGLRKKLDLKDSYTFRIQKADKHLAGEVDRLDDPNAKALSPLLEAEDAIKVDLLAQTIRASLKDLYMEREAVARVEIEGKDVYKTKLALSLVGRMVRTFAPIVEEITRRSPSTEELSLKLENDKGKREELYLRRDELLSKLQPLNAEGREVFAPLGLDDWVPTLTIEPTAVDD